MTRRVKWGFALLCLLAGSTWLWDEVWPPLLSGLLRVAVHVGVLALAFALAANWRGGRDLRDWLKVASGAAALFAVPQVLLAASGGHVSEFTEALVFMLVPVVVIVVEAQRAAGFGGGESPLRRMLPALLAVGGAALLLPFAWPVSTPGWCWLAAIVFSAGLSGWAAAWMPAYVGRVGVLRSAAIACASTALAAAACLPLGWTGAPVWVSSSAGFEALRTLVFDPPILLLTVWLLRALPPIGFSARLLLIPLVTILESFVLLRPAAAWTTWLGLLLLVGGGLALLRPDSNEML